MKLGIDLGTTRSAVAIVEGEEPDLLQNTAGDRLTPSVVYYDEEGDILVGKQAVQKQKLADGRLVRHAKRHMGDEHTFEIGDEDYTPVDVSAEILKQLESDASEFVDDVSGAIITVPAYFTVDQKADTRKAAERAGFDDVDLLHEPTAAAIAYGYDEEMTEKVFVYDFGGGTLDISVMRIEGNNFNMLATSGDTELGGIDFTEAIIDWLAEKYEDDHGVDLREGSETRGSLREVAEQAKIDLSSREQTEVNAPLMGQIDGEVHGITKQVLERNTFEEVCEELLDRAISPIYEALEKADLETDDVDRVLLVGGSSKIPAIQERLEEEFGFEPTKTNDLDRLVAQGAAIVADLDGGIEEDYICPICGQGFGIFGDFNKHLTKAHDSAKGSYECPYCDETLASEQERQNHIGHEHKEELEDSDGDKVGLGKDKILTRSLGTDLIGGRMDILIPHGTELPAKATSRYVPSMIGQEQLPVHVYQGEDTENLYENVKLKDWYVDLPSSDDERPTVDVTFEVDSDGILHVSATPEGEDSENTQLDIYGGGSGNQNSGSNTQKGGADD